MHIPVCPLIFLPLTQEGPDLAFIKRFLEVRRISRVTFYSSVSFMKEIPSAWVTEVQGSVGKVGGTCNHGGIRTTVWNWNFPLPWKLCVKKHILVRTRCSMWWWHSPESASVIRHQQWLMSVMRGACRLVATAWLWSLSFYRALNALQRVFTTLLLLVVLHPAQSDGSAAVSSLQVWKWGHWKVKWPALGHPAAELRLQLGGRFRKGFLLWASLLVQEP